MSEHFRFDDPFVPLPAAATDASPAEKIRDLLFRVSKLERTLDDEKRQYQADLRDLMLDLISISDDLAVIAERSGLATRAQEAATIGGVIAVGRKLVSVLRKCQVKPIETIGESLDTQTSDAISREQQESLPANTVLREVRIGYVWPHGILRLAQVVVSSRPEAGVEAEPVAGNGKNQ